MTSGKESKKPRTPRNPPAPEGRAPLGGPRGGGAFSLDLNFDTISDKYFFDAVSGEF